MPGKQGILEDGMVKIAEGKAVAVRSRNSCYLPEVANEFAQASVVAVDTFHQQDGEEDL